VRESVRAARAAGKSVRVIAQEPALSVGSVQRAVALYAMMKPLASWRSRLAAALAALGGRSPETTSDPKRCHELHDGDCRSAKRPHGSA
jgi:hypothetical protein